MRTNDRSRELKLTYFMGQKEAPCLAGASGGLGFFMLIACKLMNLFGVPDGI